MQITICRGRLVRFIFAMRLRWCMMLEQSKIFFSDTLAATGASGDTQSTVLDLAKLASSLNRKHIPNIDRNGNAQVFLVKIKGVMGTNALNVVRTAPNLYTTKAAVKAWHDARVEMITRTGAKMSDLGPYARHLRPFLDVNHENGTTTEQSASGSVAGGLPYNTHFQGEEYTRTKIAVTVPVEETLASGANSSFRPGNLVDEYSLTLCDASVDEATTAEDADSSDDEMDQDSFVSVGMIDSWLSSIKKRPTGTGDSVRIQADNPLLQLMVDSPSSEEVLEIVESSAEEGRPWDLDGSAYTSLTGQAFYLTNANRSESQVFEVPCGLLELTQLNLHSAEDLLYTEIEILDVYDM